MTAPGDSLDRLLAESEIRNLVARLAHLADDGDLEAYLALWTPDAVWSRDTGEICRGTAALRERVLAYRAAGLQGPGTGSTHINTTLLVEVTGPDTATARSTFLFLAGGAHPLSPDPQALKSQPVMVGRYDDRFVRTSAGWRISSRTIIAV